MNSFLKMPANWEEREDRWEKLTTRGSIWTELRRFGNGKSVGQVEIDQLRADLEEWRKAKGRYTTGHQFEFIEKLLDMAELSRDGEAAKGIIRALEPDEREIYFALIGKPIDGDSQTNSNISVLLEEGGVGILARLEVEILKDGTGKLYPDPISNGFIEFDPDFMNAAKDAWSKVIHVVTERVSERDSLGGVDVRFKLDRIPIPELGNSPLKVISGKSAQLAFYLCLFQSAKAYLGSSEGIMVDQSVAASATIKKGENLGRVEGLSGKLEAAYLKGLDAVIVSKDIETEAQGALEAAKARSAKTNLHSTPKIVGAGSITEAVDILRDRAREREAYRKYLQETLNKLDILGLYQDVPMESHYIALPLLLHVPEKELPREENGSREEAKGYTGLRESDIRRWEERVQKSRASFLPMHLEELFTDYSKIRHKSGKKTADNIPRCIILGPPGSGKSTLTQYLSWRASNGGFDICGRQTIPALVRLKEWEASKHLDLPEYLEERYRNILHAPTIRHWRNWLQRGSVLLLLDGLDEISDNDTFRHALKESLDFFKNCPMVLTCRSVSFEQHKALCPDLPLFTLGGIERTERNSYIQKFPAQNRDRFDPEGLIKELDSTPQMRPLSENPLLLSIICYVLDGKEKIKLPTRRGVLFEKVVEKLLDRKKGESPTRPSRSQMRWILESAALDLFSCMARRRQLIFDADSLTEALTRGAEACGLGNPGDIAGSLMERVKDSGVLRGDNDQGYFFLHLTVQEFLAACALARQINDPKRGWNSEVELESHALPLYRFIDCKSWDPQWQEAITLMAGQLKDPKPLLELLSDTKKDDLYRHRFGLSILCLGELKAEILDSYSDFVDSLTSTAFMFWWKSSDNYKIAPEMHKDFARILPVLGQLNRKIGSESLLEWLFHQIDIRLTKVSMVLGSMGSSAANPLILERLADMLLNPKEQNRVAHVLRRIGSPAATPLILERLADMLFDPERQDIAADVLGSMGSAAADPLILERLADMLLDPERQDIAAEALGSIGKAAATPLVVERLTDMLQDPQGQDIAAEALDSMGSPATVPSLILDKLADMLLDPKGRNTAVEALGRIGSAAATPFIMDRLADMLLDPQEREVAVETFGRIGNPAASPLIMDRLSDMLLDPQERGIAAEALANTANPGASPQVMDRLADMLLDQSFFTRNRAAEALGRIGSAAATPLILERLTSMLEGLVPSSSIDLLLNVIEAIGNKEVRVFRGADGKLFLREIDELADCNASSPATFSESFKKALRRSAQFPIDCGAKFFRLALRAAQLQKSVWL